LCEDCREFPLFQIQFWIQDATHNTFRPYT
jgi:hypothetical protein